MGIALRLLVPFANRIILQELGFSIVPWYPISDSLLIVMTPVMTAMVCAFVILDERDEGIGVYYSVTPSGGRVYLISRIAIPMVWAFVSTVLVLSLFSLSIESFLVMLFCAFAGTMQGIVSCMILVTIAGNKVEGLALAKLTNLFLIGFIFSWFVSSPSKYIFGILPSFWIGELLLSSEQGFANYVLPAILGVVCSLVWILILYRKFIRRVY